MSLVNLTPISIIIGHLNDKEFCTDLTIESSGEARVKTSETPCEAIDGIPVNKVKFLEVENLPQPKEGVRYIVSMPVQQFASGRDDLLSPYSEKAFRSDDGKTIFGVPGLVRYTSFPEQSVNAEKTDAQFKKFVNVSFQPVAIFTGDKQTREIPKADKVAKLKTEETDVSELNGIKCYTIKFAGIENLPEKEDGVIYIAPMPVAQATGRSDVYAADTGTNAVRNDQNRIIGTKALAHYIRV